MKATDAEANSRKVTKLLLWMINLKVRVEVEAMTSQARAFYNL